MENITLKWQVKDSTRQYWTIIAEMTDSTENRNGHGQLVLSSEDGEVVEKHHWWNYSVSSEDGWNVKGKVLGQYDSNISLKNILHDMSWALSNLMMHNDQAKRQ